MIYLFSFLIVFTAAVLVHELGHFLAARALGMKVYEFSIGFPVSPRVIRFFKHKETEFTLRLLPLGGFVAFSKDGDPDGSSGFLAVQRWKRAIVVSAGPAFNAVFAFICIAAALAFGKGLPVIESAVQGLYFMQKAITGFFMLFSGSGPGFFESISGPLGIAMAAGQAAQSGGAGLLAFTGLLSLSLAVFNLLPVPALDGGQLVTIGIEAVRRKALGPAFYRFAGTAGIAVFVILTLIASWRDVSRILA